MHIKPEFDKQAKLQLVAVNDSETDSDADGDIGVLTLEMTDNPFSSLLRRIENLLDAGSREDIFEALSLARAAVREKIFDDRQQDKLSQKLGEIIDIIHAERELGCAFTKGALGIISATEPEPAPSLSPYAAPRLAT